MMDTWERTRIGRLHEPRENEALNNIKDAIRGWLEVEERHRGVHIPEEREVFLGEVTV